VTRDARDAERSTASRRARLWVMGALVVLGGLVGLALSPQAQAATRTAAHAPSSATSVAAARAITGTSSPNPSIHGPYGVTTDACASCHRAHTGAGQSLTTYPTQSQLCLSCHDGTGATTNVAHEYTYLVGLHLTNDPTTRSYYEHDPVDSTGHTMGIDDEFTGVTNRHSECTDCHNPHSARTSPAASQSAVTAAWAPSGALIGSSSVAVTNGQAGQTPDGYTFQNGKNQAMTAEYQLCFKCHSGNTILLSNDGFKPSQFELDKGVEFNPANPSTHPVEGPGNNQTLAMQKSLTDVFGTYRTLVFPTEAASGVSPTQRVVRCTNCHTGGPAAQPTTTGDGTSPVHVSANRGILVAPYLDRTLEPYGKDYDAADFALCFTCHSERPFSTNSPAGTTNFTLHRFHVAGIGTLINKPTGGTDIDTAGDGQGNATCSECHFRLHSTIYAVGQSINKRLVNFAPDVQPYNGTLSFSLLPVDVNGVSHGSCTLVCHGVVHDKKAY
jgi:predicted CXXCH cytochrome family protein